MTASAPLLYEIPARLLVEKFHRADGSPLTLANIPESWFEQMAWLKVQFVWLMGVWQLGPKGREISLNWGRDSGEFDRLLPGWTPQDVTGSPYCVQDYSVHTDFGGNDGLGIFRSKLRERGIGLILDFVPNHTARDHRWVKEHPEYYIQRDTAGVPLSPDQFTQQDGHDFAYGRDPYFPSWTDVFQLDYRRESLHQAMIGVLEQIAPLCDGVRCDMSMLVLPDVVERTWGQLPTSLTHEAAQGSFWPRAIDRVRSRFPEFLFIAEAYWGLEYRLQTMGFDHTYDKSLYDALVDHDLAAVRGKLREWTPLGRGVHFLENHDEPRAAARIGPDAYRRACAVFNAALPGIRLLHEGQLDGRRLRYCIHLRRAAEEPLFAGEKSFYDRLLSALADSAIGQGRASLIPAQATGPENRGYDAIQAIFWETECGGGDLVIVNLSGQECDARLPLFFVGIGGRQWRLHDRLSGEEFIRQGDEICGPGLYVKLPANTAQILCITRAG